MSCSKLGTAKMVAKLLTYLQHDIDQTENAAMKNLRYKSFAKDKSVTLTSGHNVMIYRFGSNVDIQYLCGK